MIGAHVDCTFVGLAPRRENWESTQNHKHGSGCCNQPEWIVQDRPTEGPDTGSVGTRSAAAERPSMSPHTWLGAGLHPSHFGDRRGSGPKLGCAGVPPRPCEQLPPPFSGPSIPCGSL